MLIGSGVSELRTGGKNFTNTNIVLIIRTVGKVLEYIKI